MDMSIILITATVSRVYTPMSKFNQLYILKMYSLLCHLHLYKTGENNKNINSYSFN